MYWILKIGNFIFQYNLENYGLNVFIITGDILIAPN